MAVASRARLWRRPRGLASAVGGGGGRVPNRRSSVAAARSTVGVRAWTPRWLRRSRASKMSPSTSSSPATYARAKPSSPGRNSTRRIASGVCTTTLVGVSGPTAVPSHNSIRTGGFGPTRPVSRSITTPDTAVARMLVPEPAAAGTPALDESVPDTAASPRLTSTSSPTASGAAGTHSPRARPTAIIAVGHGYVPSQPRVGTQPRSGARSSVAVRSWVGSGHRPSAHRWSSR